MQKAAHLAASIEILDAYLTGDPLEKALTNWARRARFAGSRDRAAIRDIVFQIVRCRRSYGAHAGSPETGRALAVGYLVSLDERLEDWFGASPYAPDALTQREQDCIVGDISGVELARRLDCPDWLGARLQTDLGDQFEPIMAAMQNRAPVYLRVNVARTTRAKAVQSLAEDGIVACAVSHCKTALEVTENARRIAQSGAFKSGVVELQDVASQLACEALPIAPKRVLDFCAGGGGKSLALAANHNCKVWAHDIAPRRMQDLPARARRAGASISLIGTEEMAGHAPFDLVFCDAPCSGSGAWRRSPEGKWALTANRLAELQKTQKSILDHAANLVSPQGCLVYATCSLLCCENEDQVGAFLDRHSSWTCLSEQRLSPLDGAEGFYFTYLTPEKAKD